MVAKTALAACLQFEQFEYKPYWIGLDQKLESGGPSEVLICHDPITSYYSVELRGVPII